MPDQISDIQKELEQSVSVAIAKLASADQSNANIARAYGDALDLHTLLHRPIRIAIGGEFSSGKSTFVKMLLGRHVVKTQASASAMPTVHFLFGADTAYRTIRTDSSQEVSDLNALSEDDLRELKCLEVMVDVPFLKEFEIFDTPGTSDPSRDIDQLLTIADQVDFIIWCTNATQAWRESERRMWESLPFELKKRSLLLVTHVDLPSVKSSVGRLMKRMQKEAGPLFNNIIPMELLAASFVRNKNGKVTDQAVWKDSGGAECLASMKAIATEVRADVIKSAEYDLKNKIMPVVAKLKTGPAPFLSYWTHELNKIQTNLANADNATVSLSYLKLLEGALAFSPTDTQPSFDDAKKITI